MPLTVAIQMDPPQRLNPAFDSTLILGLEAQKRGHILYYYPPEWLYLDDGTLCCRSCPIEFFAGEDAWYRLGAP